MRRDGLLDLRDLPIRSTSSSVNFPESNRSALDNCPRRKGILGLAHTSFRALRCANGEAIEGLRDRVPSLALMSGDHKYPDPARIHAPLGSAILGPLVCSDVALFEHARHRLPRTGLEYPLGQRPPLIFNIAQGAQFINSKWTDRIKPRNILLSMDGRSRASTISSPRDCGGRYNMRILTCEPIIARRNSKCL